MLDTYRPVETPEGVEIGLRVAGPVPRLYAALLDAGIRMILYFALAIVAGTLGKSGLGFLFVAIFLVEWFYPVVFEVKSGATPGKKQMGLLVLHRDGTPVGWTASVIRNLVRFADFLPAAYGFGLGTMLVDRDFRRLGDLAAGTVVVHREPAISGARVPAAPPLRPPVSLALDEQRAVIEFAERLGTWPAARSAELAAILQPLTATTAPPQEPEGVQRLVGMANWLLGRR
jgi:uncharacterized RDD family membrane protein YckC